jgi:hypothetical protein
MQAGASGSGCDNVAGGLMKKILKAAKVHLGDRLVVLSDIFRNTSGFPPGVSFARYRANHPDWIEALNGLEVDQLFLKRSSDSTQYRIRVYALPLLNEKRAQRLLDLMDRLFLEFREFYREKLNAPIKTSEIFELARRKLGVADTEFVREALFYMMDSHGIWSGMTNDFPFADDSSINISEDVLRKDSFRSQLAQVYEWHIVNPKKTAEGRRVKLVGTRESARRRREQRVSKARSAFLGSSSGVLPEWYEQLGNAQKALIKELDQAIAKGMAALPTMGLRTLLELVMRDHIADKGTFKGNVEAFEEAGFITKQQANLISNVIDAGNAAAHRAYFPNHSDLTTCVDAVRHLMEGVYILKPKVDAVVVNTPKRT